MTKEEKQLLLKDLCGRLPYGVIVATTNLAVPFGVVSGVSTKNKVTVETKHADIVFDCTEVKPYLRPMSSMTEEELYEVQEILGKGIEIHDVFITTVDSSIDTFSYLELQAVFDWFNAHHFDYCGLIEKGLALEAQEGMYNIKENNKI